MKKIEEALMDASMRESLTLMKTSVEGLALTRRNLEVINPELVGRYDQLFTETVDYYFNLFKEMDILELMAYMHNRYGKGGRINGGHK